MTDQQRHREAVERYIADSQGRIAGQKLRLAELEAQGDNSSILSKSLQRAENSLAMMMAYRDGPTTGGRRCIERPYRLSQRLTSWTELWNAFVCEGEHRVRIDASRLAVAALHSPQRHRSVQGDRIEPLSSAVQFQITWETAMKRAASSQAANQDGCVSPQPSRFAVPSARWGNTGNALCSNWLSQSMEGVSALLTILSRTPQSVAPIGTALFVLAQCVSNFSSRRFFASNIICITSIELEFAAIASFGFVEV